MTTKSGNSKMFTKSGNSVTYKRSLLFFFHRLDRDMYCIVSMDRPCSLSSRTNLVNTLPIIMDKGNKFLAEFREIIINNYSIEK